MRFLRKRLVCRHRENHEKTIAEMDTITARYVHKMAEKGWHVFEGGNITQASAFFYFERYVTLAKP